MKEGAGGAPKQNQILDLDITSVDEYESLFFTVTQVITKIV